MIRSIALYALSSIGIFCSAATLPAGELASFESVVKPFLLKNCIHCHGADTQEGDVAFHTLAGVDVNNAELWKRVWEQVALKEMPPREERNQPLAAERLQLASWITCELQRSMKDNGGFNAHLLPAKGNHLPHELLFGEIPEGLEPPSTAARIWRIHPQEHLTRLNELIAKEPAYDPARPGVRARGDHIPPNEDGEVKVYYGLDRLIGWVGGTAAYAAAITGFPPVLSTDDHRGLRNYPILHSVNGSEATQIASIAEDILRFMAYGPKAEPYQFADDIKDIDPKYKHGDLRGLNESLFYAKQPTHPMTPVHDLMHESGVSSESLRAAVNFLFESLTGRPPLEAESDSYVRIATEAINDLGKQEGAFLGLAPIFLDRDALFRPELVNYGVPDQYGRVMLQGQELALAINAAFSYIPPDTALKQAVQQGKMNSAEDAKREVHRILNDDSFRKPRVLQFFREYFDYDRAGGVCKDAKALVSAGGDPKAELHFRAMVGMIANTDRLIEIILEQDKDVLYEMLTTDKVVYNESRDARYFGEFVGVNKTALKEESPEKKAEKKAEKKKGPSIPNTVRAASLPVGQPEHVRIAQVVKPLQTERSLTSLPTDQRVGILTHPAWLVSHSDAMDNHAILRGRWIRERLLGDSVPDVPITVDAMLPDEPRTTLRHRMRVTREEYCWKCHQKMDPLGLPFESYNHLGLYRIKEQEEPVDTSGAIIHSGDAALDGPVANAIEMIHKLAKSDRVKQVFVRHAFRYWMGRNETVNDAPVLQAAYRAYEENGGSMNALLESLLTSDAFLYRKR